MTRSSGSSSQSASRRPKNAASSPWRYMEMTRSTSRAASRTRASSSLLPDVAVEGVCVDQSTVPSEKLRELEPPGGGNPLGRLERRGASSHGMFRRFFVADDVNVDRFIIRDSGLAIERGTRLRSRTGSSLRMKCTRSGTTRTTSAC